MPLQPDANGIVRSRIMPGLWLAVPALLTGDIVKVLAVLQEGLNSLEHREFVKQLSNQK